MNGREVIRKVWTFFSRSWRGHTSFFFFVSDSDLQIVTNIGSRTPLQISRTYKQPWNSDGKLKGILFSLDNSASINYGA